MHVLIVYGSQYGNTQRVAQAMARALAPSHHVDVAHAPTAATGTGERVELLIVGAPTQMRGARNLADPFLAGIEGRGCDGVAAAAFDTRLAGIVQKTAGDVIAERLAKAGCRLVAPPAGFFVTGLEGPLATGEEERAAAWANAVAKKAATKVAVR